jgi:hypothetical protein
MSWEWFYTAPIDDIAVRRGDPLGLRSFAEGLAEMLAPGLSNRTVDARWITIVCWALDQGLSAWEVFRGDGSGTAAGDKTGDPYAWIRPLELLWVARTVVLTSDQGKRRQLPGVRSVRGWVEGTGRDRFGLPLSSYQRYRFTGPYGAYRVALRALPGLTTDGQGWHLDHLGRQLAQVAHGKVECPRVHRRGRRLPEPERFWNEAFAWDRPGSFLPTQLPTPKALPYAERRPLFDALFSTDRVETAGSQERIRRQLIVEAAAASSAVTHVDLFDDLARSFGNRTKTHELDLLAPFYQLADTGVGAMNACWTAVREGNSTGTGFVPLSDVLDRKEVKQALDDLASAAHRWKQETTSRRTTPAANALAEGILAAGRDRRKQLQAIERHHRMFGGGLKWMAIEDEMLKPLAPLRGGTVNPYRFRVSALCRLGVQCGVINEMPAALRGTAELEDELATEETA